MGYLYREAPYGTKARQRKGTLYKVADPFLRFHYHYVYPNLSQLLPQRIDTTWERLKESLPQFVAQQWEVLCQRAVGSDPELAVRYDFPARWWGTVSRGVRIELDLVARSSDGDSLLVGECKWSTIADAGRIRRQLIEKATKLPFYRGEPIETMLFAKRVEQPDGGVCWTPADVLNRLQF
jgi:AAA+ ATPase superfamily predicted ATPase